MFVSIRRAVAGAAMTLAPITAPAQSSLPDAIYYKLPGMANVTVTSNVTYRHVGESGRDVPLTMDVYRPPAMRPGQRLPALIFVHGGLTLDQPRTAKDWGIYQSWGRVAAASGLVGVTFNHRMTTNDNVDVASGDVRAAIDLVRRNAAEWNVDPDRLCLAFYSA
jgi:acetyl esterase/lipase